MTKQEQFSLAFEKNDFNLIKLLIKDKNLNPCIHDNYFFRYASERGHTEIIKLLLNDPRVNPNDRGNYSLKLSSINGHTEIVKLLLNDSRVDPTVADLFQQTDNIDLLWKDKRFKNTLLMDNQELYNKLMKKDIISKMKSF
jgi:ankyrin repeat protein